MAAQYDDQNIFAKIIRGEIPNNTVLETEHTLAFNDIAPQAPVHILVIPKGPYVSIDHFMAKASDAEILDFNRAVATITENLGLALDVGGAGFRAIANSGVDGVQDVPHFHLHLLGGAPMGRMLSKSV